MGVSSPLSNVFGGDDEDDIGNYESALHLA